MSELELSLNPDQTIIAFGAEKFNPSFKFTNPTISTRPKQSDIIALTTNSFCCSNFPQLVSTKVYYDR